MPHEGGQHEQLKILLVEDSPEDAELLSDQLLDAGIDAAFERVDSEPSLRAAMERFQPDIVLSDLSMPGFSGHQALRLVRQSGATPFIFVSGTMGEETAVKALQDGANDYIIKHNPTRLPSAVLRAIREARAEIERQRVESELMRAQRLESLAMLAAGLSHDLRNILQPLLIVPDLLAGRTDDPNCASWPTWWPNAAAVAMRWPNRCCRSCAAPTSRASRCRWPTCSRRCRCCSRAACPMACA